MVTMAIIGTMLYGYCEGYFGRDSYSNKRIEAVGVDWLVARNESGRPEYTTFDSPTEMLECITRWSNKGDIDE